MLYFHLKPISVARVSREKGELRALTLAGHWSPPNLSAGAAASSVTLERAQPHLSGSHSHSHASILPSEPPKSNKTNPLEAPIHLNKHY